MKVSSIGVGIAAFVGLTSAASCGPGPLPPENPAETLSTPPEPVAVQVQSTAEESSDPNLTPTLTEAPQQNPEPPVIAPAGRGFAVPESILYDAANDKYFVSNVNGSPNDADNNGFVSVINPDGSVHQLDFIAGGKNGVTLNAPKGLALHGETLYVADITAVRKFNAKTGAAQGSIPFPNSTFINDVVADGDGTLYVSDTGIKINGNDVTPTGTDAIYKVVKGKVQVFAKGEHLSRPNGVALVNGALVAVTFGKNQLFVFDAQGNITSTAELPATTLDGVVALPNGHLLVSSWEKQAVYVGSVGGPWSVASDGLPSPADIGFDSKRGRVLVPIFAGNELRFVTLAASAVDASAPGAAAGASAPPSSSGAAERPPGSRVPPVTSSAPTGATVTSGADKPVASPAPATNTPK